MTASAGLARVTVSAPRRRLDVAVPEHAPLAELLPELLRHAGEGLADEGQAHGGWVLRRPDGAALSAGVGLAAQGVRDGAVLHLVPARVGWPELEYDDVVEAIAAGARRYGRSWDAGATRAAGLVFAGLAAAAGVVALWFARLPGLTAAGGAMVLLLAGVLASRAYGDGIAGAVLAGYALPYAALAGAAVPAGRGAPARLLLASVAVLLAAAVGALGSGRLPRLFVAATVLGCAGTVGALAAGWLPPAGSAAVVQVGLVTLVLAVPVAAVRLGKLPVPVPTPVTLGSAPTGPPDADRLYASVVRADELLTGGLTGIAAGSVLAGAVLVRAGGAGGLVLVAVAGGALLLRARVFAAVRQRLPLLLAGAGAVAALLAALPRTGGTGQAVAAGLVVVTLLLVAAGSAYRGRTPGPYLGRAADILEALCVLAVVPAACAVLGLYGLLGNLTG